MAIFEVGTRTEVLCNIAATKLQSRIDPIGQVFQLNGRSSGCSELHPLFMTNPEVLGEVQRKDRLGR